MAFRIQRLRGNAVAVTEVAGERLTIGRGTNNGLRFDDTAVALEHAVVEREGGSWALADRGSVTGTWIHGRRIDAVRLADGDVVGIGSARITVRLPPPGEPAAPLLLEVRERREEEADRGTPTEETLTATAAAQAAPVAWAEAYRLPQNWLTRPRLALAVVLAALVAVVALAAGGRTTAFRPGPLSAAHAGTVAARDCRACHQPWRGAADRRCAECHESHPVHQPTQAETPPCGGCHGEHRGQESLTSVTAASCTGCHADLQVAGGGGPRFARRVTEFGTDHPELAVAVADAAGGERRLPLSDPEARRADPATLRFNHAEHLKPDLVTPEGRLTLPCAACHRVEEAGEHLRPLAYEEHCQRCHLLNFEIGFPDKVVPHGEPSLVRNYLIGEYSSDDAWKDLSLEEKTDLVRRGRAPRSGQSALEAATRAEADLYPRTCDKCHAVGHGASLPQVAPPAVPGDWLPHARFPHGRHGEEAELTCASCHEAAASREAADVLLPGIAVCRRCHGEGERTARRRILSTCADCHRYHSPATTSEARFAGGL